MIPSGNYLIIIKAYYIRIFVNINDHLIALFICFRLAAIEDIVLFELSKYLLVLIFCKLLIRNFFYQIIIAS